MDTFERIVNLMGGGLPAVVIAALSLAIWYLVKWNKELLAQKDEQMLARLEDRDRYATAMHETAATLEATIELIKGR